MNFNVGSLVTVRGRDWVVQPYEGDDWLILKPLGGSDAEKTAVSPALESIQPASFALPDPNRVGDARSCRLLRDAVRLGLRSTTGPFRSFGHIAVAPRPYQLVPLLMAMRQPIVRLLIADDVGIGKTVEALLIIRELLDRGEIRRFTVLCPPQLAEQWQREMADKFHIAAETVLPSTVNRLERGLGASTSLFQKYPFTIVSLDYIKSDRHRLDFLRTCPEMVIVDEAHTCASPSGGRGSKQRYDLIQQLSESPDRHMLFVTATPHSGKEDCFRSLLCFLNPDLAGLSDTLEGKEHEKDRQFLAQYFVQRRRGDIQAYMNTDTPFPVRKTQELTWKASAQWIELFQKILKLAKDSINSAKQGSQRQQRISWWSALALLRTVSSSPAAAAQTLRTRANGVDSGEENPDDLDSWGSQSILDGDACEDGSVSDTLPGADTSCGETKTAPLKRRRFTDLADLAENLKGANDNKLQQCIPHIKNLLKDGFSPIIFCRFITTAEYLAEELRKVFTDSKKGQECAVEAVTSTLPPSEREARVAALAKEKKRVLVCTDCLSEGINLQEYFDAVIHYDLSWNPTRHEQREGRVDRFGQPSHEVHIITWYSTDSPMDGMILDVLLRKHEAIRRALGISVPIPEDSQKIVETLIQGLILRGKPKTNEQNMPLLPGLGQYMDNEKQRVAVDWDKVAKREQKRSNTLFVQRGIEADKVAASLNAANEACGSALDVENFVANAYPLLDGVVQSSGREKKVLTVNFDKASRSRHAGLELPDNNTALVFSPPAAAGQILLTRTHPMVEQLAAYLAETALDPQSDALVARCGAMRTEKVIKRTTLLLCRFRFLITTSGDVSQSTLAEECLPLVFEGSPAHARWLPADAANSLLQAEPSGNISSEQAAEWVRKAESDASLIQEKLLSFMRERGQILLNEHRAAREAASQRNRHVAQRRLRYAVQPQGDPDILGMFIYLPATNE